MSAHVFESQRVGKWESRKPPKQEPAEQVIPMVSAKEVCQILALCRVGGAFELTTKNSQSLWSWRRLISCCLHFEAVTIATTSKCRKCSIDKGICARLHHGASFEAPCPSQRVSASLCGFVPAGSPKIRAHQIPIISHQTLRECHEPEDAGICRGSPFAGIYGPLDDQVPLAAPMCEEAPLREGSR